MSRDQYIILDLIIINLVAGFGFAIPIALCLRKITSGLEKFFRYFAMLIGIFVAECVAFAAGMCTQIFTFGLAFVWGIALGLWLRDFAPAKKVLKTIFFVSVYGCLPTCAFAVILIVIWLVNGNSLMNVEQADKFGIPQFVPWPFNTMLGFCVGLAIGTILLKTVITTGIVSIFIHRRQNKDHRCLLHKQQRRSSIQ